MKTDAFEDDLRQVLSARAAEVPQAAAGRLAGLRYQPRIRSRLTLAAAGLAATATASAAIAVTVLATASHPPGHQPGRPATARLAAWTVTKLASGNISITIRELKDPAGLQSTLRADGVPASVTFSSQLNPACRPYPGGTPGIPPFQASSLLKRVFPEPYKRLPASLPRLPRRLSRVPAHARRPAPFPAPGHALIVIDPSALPGHAGVQLGTSSTGGAVLLPQVVQASPECTGR